VVVALALLILVFMERLSGRYYRKPRGERRRKLFGCGFRVNKNSIDASNELEVIVHVVSSN